MFSSLKLYAIGAGLLAYSVGLWVVSSGYAENKYNKERLEMSRQVIRSMDKNSELSSQLSQGLAKLDQDRQNLSANILKELHEGILADPVYKSCRTTDRVRDALQRKLDAQAGRAPAPAVPKKSS